MDRVIQGERVTTRSRSDPAHQAFRMLHLAFVVAPTIAGLDKFFHMLVNWDKYLAPQIAELSPWGGHTLMLIVGAVEVAAGLLVALKPKVGGVVVGLWLLGIIANLVLLGSYWDVALRDLGLALGAFALSRLASQHDLDKRIA